MSKKNLAVIIGGKSPEHAISLRSGLSVVNSLDKSKYDITVIGIDKEGTWHLQDTPSFIDHPDDTRLISLKPSAVKVFLEKTGKRVWLYNKATQKKIKFIDIAFPVLHGAYGEDGIIQGLFRSLELAFVGADLMASAIGMDKDIAKRLWRDAGIPVADFEVITVANKSRMTYATLSHKLGKTLFVKPANAGSSVGVHKVENQTEFEAAVIDAFKFDRKLLVEEAIKGIEVECAVLGNENPRPSVIGGIIPTEKFYSYDAKYISSTGAKLMIPANIRPDVSSKLRKTAVKAYQCIGAEGLSRVDFFLREDNTFILNEINTMPGFTSISMYPKLWEASGLPYPDLLDRLISLGIKRHREVSKLKTSW